MSPPSRLAAALFTVSWLLTGTSESAESTNLLSNGGFEEGLTSWNPAAGHSLETREGRVHTGKACLTGEVTRPDQALILRRDLKVGAGNLYEFQIWARATEGTKLVLWVVPPGQKQRRMVQSWEKVPKEWRRYTTAIPVSSDGNLKLEIVAPSSHQAPAGRIWIDDVALNETRMPGSHSVSQGVGFNDEPALAVAGDDSIYVAWNSFRKGSDSLRLARLVPDESREGYREDGQWEVAGGEDIYILSPLLVADGTRVYLLYSAEIEGSWDIHAVPCSPSGPGGSIRVTTGEAVDVKPAAVLHGARLWIAWESNRNGTRQVFATSLEGEKTSGPFAVSDSRFSSYDPSIEALASGEVYVAWHAFRENNYDVYLRRRRTSGEWSASERVTEAPAIDRHAVLRSRGDELWLLYEHAQTEKYHIGRTNFRRIIAARITQAGLMEPQHSSGVSPLMSRGEGVDARFDSMGRLWLTYLRPFGQRAGWQAWKTCYSEGRWLEPTPLSSRKGMDRPPVLAVAGKRGIVAFQVDDMPGSWSDLDRTLLGKSDILITSFLLSEVEGEAAFRFAPLSESTESFEPGRLRVERGEDMSTPSIQYRGERLELFFGDLHEHTDVSVCNRLGDQSIDESYQHMRDIARHDFACTTDHGYNLNPYLWGYTAKLARANADAGRFLTFLAEEWTSTFEEYDTEHPYGFYGHRNLIFEDPYFPRWWNARNRQTPAEVWEDLRKLDAGFVHIPHQLADTGNVPTDWDFTDEEAQPVAEIFQTRGSYEFKGTPREARRTTPAGYFLQDAWARGIVIGVIASPDHGGGYGKACVYAPELTRKAVLEALRARRCYGTTAAKICLDVRVNGHLMGEKVAGSPGEEVRVSIRARCPGALDRVEVCRNNRFIYSRKMDEGRREIDLTFTDRDPLEGRSYYYVRVIQKDEEIAWSSPVWFSP